ncbi:hypothetical protein FM076_07455 [Streptomyces albus subsp. chlorinus]|nr:hypothetical protein [Streptomyces albus subsp. chlorinus]
MPVMRPSVPGVLFRALTMPSGPRMLQVALRACVPRTEQAALASVVCPLGFPAFMAVRLTCMRCDQRALGVAVPTTSCPYRRPFPT